MWPEKIADFDTCKKLPKNVGDLGKLIVTKGIKKLPKVQKIAQSGHTEAGYGPFLRTDNEQNWWVH